MNAKSKSRSARSRPERFAAKLLFQLRFENEGSTSPMRLAEQRIIIVEAPNPDHAYKQALRYGASKQESFLNEDGVEVRLEFVGVMDLMHLGAEADENEVWYEVKRMRAPLERKSRLIPRKSDLGVFKQFPRTPDKR